VSSRVSTRRPRSELLLVFGLALGAALIAGFTLLRGIDHFDEGIVLQAARRVAAGQLPYRDFLWSYGPGHPYLLGLSFKLFGPSLLGWRIVRLVTVAVTSLVVFFLTRRLAGTRWALLAWLTAACALAQPANASPFPPALLFALAAVAVASTPGLTGRRALLAGALVALAAVWRLDFGIYGGVGAAVAVLLSGGAPRERLGLLVRMGIAAVGLTLLAYLPFLIATGPSDLYEDLIGKSLREKRFWTLPFPLAYHGTLRGWPPRQLAEDLKDALGFYLPLVVIAGLGLAALVAAARLAMERRLAPAWAGLLVVGAGSTAYLLSRTDEFHATPLLVVLAVALPAAAAWGFGTRATAGRALAVLCALALAPLLLYGAANRLSALFLPPTTEPIHVAAADGVRAPPAEARAIERVVAEVQRRVPVGAPIYVAPRRSDLVAFEDPLTYVLTERDNPTHDDVELRAGARAQARVVGALERSRPRVVVRWTDPLSSRHEQNPRGRSSGVHTLDLYLARRYRVFKRLYHYELLERR
jgi:hypothetical protein